MVTLGDMSVVCTHCSALLWKDETKGICCLDGKVKLKEIDTLKPLRFLLTSDYPKSNEFGNTA